MTGELELQANIALPNALAIPRILDDRFKDVYVARIDPAIPGIPRFGGAYPRTSTRSNIQDPPEHTDVSAARLRALKSRHLHAMSGYPLMLCPGGQLRLKYGSLVLLDDYEACCEETSTDTDASTSTGSSTTTDETWENSTDTDASTSTGSSTTTDEGDVTSTDTDDSTTTDETPVCPMWPSVIWNVDANSAAGGSGWGNLGGLSPRFNHGADTNCYGGGGQYTGIISACVQFPSNGMLNGNVDGIVEYQNAGFDYAEIWVNGTLLCRITSVGNGDGCDYFARHYASGSVSVRAGVDYTITCSAYSNDGLYHPADTVNFAIGYSS
jgi:hypothetical protein